MKNLTFFKWGFDLFDKFYVHLYHSATNYSFCIIVGNLWVNLFYDRDYQLLFSERYGYTKLKRFGNFYIKYKLLEDK